MRIGVVDLGTSHYPANWVPGTQRVPITRGVPITRDIGRGVPHATVRGARVST